jgi:hypothetical protein
MRHREHRTSVAVGFLVAGAIASTMCVVNAQEPPGQDELAAISARGKRLTAYDQAAWHAGDALTELGHDDSKVSCSIAQEGPDGRWRVVYGKRTEADDAFLIAYEAIQKKSPRSFVANAKTPPVMDSDYFLRASRAIDTARAAFGPVQRPYNLAILPTSDGGWFVYLFPASTSVEVWPIGGDERYTITADGRAITESRRLHKTILDIAMSKKLKSVAGFHVHVLACIPEDTDVLAVLSRPIKAAEYIACDPFAYVVDPDGSVRFLGHSKELFGVGGDSKK